MTTLPPSARIHVAAALDNVLTARGRLRGASIELRSLGRDTEADQMLEHVRSLDASLLRLKLQLGTEGEAGRL